jgi:hypothetical protein
MRHLPLVLLLLTASCLVVPPQQATTPAQQPQAVAGDCGGACTHYLSCKGMADAATHEACVLECGRMGYDGQALAEYQLTDCATAISLVEQQGGPTGGGGGGAGASQSGECQGCVRDGNECVWISQSNWGKGPYSGAVSSCSPHCCGL